MEEDELIARFLSGEASPEDAVLLEEWVSKSSLNKSYFENCIHLFSMPAEATLGAKKTGAWQKVNMRIAGLEKAQRLRRFQWGLGLAACLLGLVATVVLLYKFDKPIVKEVTYKGNGSQQKVRLSDGSEIILAAQSSLTINKDFTSSNRLIKFHGSAIFTVKHDRNRSFIIDLDKFYIKDIGTRFSIHSSKNLDTVFLNVQEGQVLAYDDAGSKALVPAGEKAYYVRSLKKLTVIRPADDISLKKVCDTCPEKPQLINGAKNKPHDLAPKPTPDTTSAKPKAGQKDSNKPPSKPVGNSFKPGPTQPKGVKDS